ncbi:hypothetical protein MASR1M60_00970 [Rhodocyclaceae bacterium]
MSQDSRYQAAEAAMQTFAESDPKRWLQLLSAAAAQAIAAAQTEDEINAVIDLLDTLTDQADEREDEIYDAATEDD